MSDSPPATPPARRALARRAGWPLLSLQTKLSALPALAVAVALLAMAVGLECGGAILREEPLRQAATTAALTASLLSYHFADAEDRLLELAGSPAFRAAAAEDPAAIQAVFEVFRQEHQRSPAALIWIAPNGTVRASEDPAASSGTALGDRERFTGALPNTGPGGHATPRRVGRP